MQMIIEIPVIVLLTAMCAASFAAEKVTLETFVDSIRSQLYAAGAGGVDPSKPLRISNVRVELNVIIESDSTGNTTVYVIEGDTGATDMATQKLSFDLEIPSDSAQTRSGPRYRTYSTNKPEYRYAPECYGRNRPYRCDRDDNPHAPVISPVIIPRNGH